MELSRRRVLVTGASRGIGAALARSLAAEGADLALVARSADQLAEVAAATGGRAYPVDLTDLDTLPDLVERIGADGPIDILVNNAGVARTGWFVDRTMDEIDQVLTLNLIAPVHLARLVLPGMLERRRGQVVSISSMAAVFAPPGLATYGATKAGLSHFMAGLQADLRDDPVSFTTVHIGSVKTEMDDEARSYGPLRQLAEQSDGRDMTSMQDCVEAIVTAIREDREQVRIPWMMAPLAAATHLPRRLGRLLFRSVPAKEHRTDRA